MAAIKSKTDIEPVMMALGERPKSDRVALDVSPSQIDTIRRQIKGHLHNAISGGSYNADHGRIAGFMSDIRALDYIEPMRADAPSKAVPAPLTAEQEAAKAQAHAASVKAAEDRAMSKVEARS